MPDLQLPVVTAPENGQQPRRRPGYRESPDDYIARIEEVAIRVPTRANRTAAAKLLGITFRALRYKLEKLGIE
jgi:two-component system response regulator PilR (NtrC family)